jgi:hypothetical protein
MEADAAPEDWEAIAARLPGSRTVPFRRRRIYYWAAAVLATLIAGGGSVYLTLQTRTDFTDTNTPDTPAIVQDVLPERDTAETPAEPPAPAESLPLLIAGAVPKLRQPALPPATGAAQTAANPAGAAIKLPNPAWPETGKPRKPLPSTEHLRLIASAAPLQTASTRKPSRKWGFGMGLGGLTQSSGEVVNTYVLKSSTYLEDEELLALNAAPDQNLGKPPRTNIKHRTPVSFGFSVSRALNTRFSLHTGLVYSLLISDWEPQPSAYNKKTRQTLHFAGIPLSLSYRIAEWNRFQVYASSGALAEVNVAGRLRTRYFFNDLQTGADSENQRMKEWQWSVNARAGVSYPLIPYIQAFAEIGAAYYFDSGSKIETIYSDKAFNISPQIGLRLSF